MELILALFIMAGATTTLLIERQRSLQHRNHLIEIQNIYFKLNNALEILEQGLDLSEIGEEEIQIQQRTETLPELGIDINIIEVSMSGPNGKDLSLQRWTQTP
jgi:hypothetical protein